MEPQTRATISATGDVQGVGYRNAVRRLARKHGLTGTVKNEKDGTVAIVVEGPRAVIEQFCAAAKVRQPPILVDDAHAIFSTSTGEFDVFRIIEGDLPTEMREGFDTGVAHLSLFRQETNGNFQALDAKYGAISQDLRSLVQKLGEKDSAISTGLAGLAEGLSGMNQNVRTIAEQLVKAVAKLDKP